MVTSLYEAENGIVCILERCNPDSKRTTWVWDPDHNEHKQ